MSGTAYGALLDAVRGIRWPARAPVRAALSGAHQSRQRGTSAEFTEYRLYRQGDDPRRIDWRLLARSDRAYIRLATDRAVLPTTLVLDASASMDFPPDVTDSKWSFARSVAVGLAGVAHSQGDPVGLIIAGRRTVELEPRTRRSVVAEIGRALAEIEPSGREPVVARIAGRILTPRLVVISDLLGDAELLPPVLRAHRASGGEAYVVHVVSPLEMEPESRIFVAVDPEDESIRRPLSGETRAGYDEAFTQWREEVARSCRASGATYVLAPTDERPERTVRRIATGER